MNFDTTMEQFKTARQEVYTAVGDIIISLISARAGGPKDEEIEKLSDALNKLTFATMMADSGYLSITHLFPGQANHPELKAWKRQLDEGPASIHVIIGRAYLLVSEMRLAGVLKEAADKMGVEGPADPRIDASEFFDELKKTIENRG